MSDLLSSFYRKKNTEVLLRVELNNQYHRLEEKNEQLKIENSHLKRILDEIDACSICVEDYSNFSCISNCVNYSKFKLDDQKFKRSLK
jgi:hypothetical protein